MAEVFGTFLERDDEASQIVSGDITDIPVPAQKLLEIGDARSDPAYGLRALAFSLGTYCVSRERFRQSTQFRTPARTAYGIPRRASIT